VWIKGATATINPITSIEIPSDVLDITGTSVSLETTINITDYLPAGVALLDSGDATISVLVDIEAYETRVFEVPIENITIEGLAAQNELTFPQGAVYVSITGLAVDLDSLDAGTLRGNVDVTDLTTGSHVVNVEMDIDAGKFVVAASRAQVNIDVKQELTEPGNGEETDDRTESQTPSSDAGAGQGVGTGADDGDQTSTGNPSDAGNSQNAEEPSDTGREDGTVDDSSSEGEESDTDEALSGR
jgi:hypothetical protein